MGLVALILLLLIVAVILGVIGIYNSCVQLLNQVKNAWSQIDVQLKRRHDLIPNLVETTRGYAKHEQQTLENLTAARSGAMTARTVADKSKAEGALSGAIGRFMMVVENYPDLKANANFLALKEELTSTENKIAFARQNYNDQVLFYNNNIQTFPSNVIAGMFHFTAQEFFELENAADRAVPRVDFS